MATQPVPNQGSSQQPQPSIPARNVYPIIFSPVGGQIPNIPSLPPIDLTEPRNRGLRVVSQSPQGVTKQISQIKPARVYMNPQVLKEAASWEHSKRINLQDEEKARLESIDEMLKPLEDPAWYHWPTWAQAIECGRHGSEEELRASEPDIKWTRERHMSEIYPQIPQRLQDAIKKYFPLNGSYGVDFMDRPLNDMEFIINHSSIRLAYLVGEKNGGTCFSWDRCPARGDAYRHIMFSINKYEWLCDLPHLFRDVRVPGGGFMNFPPLRGSKDNGYFNSFLKPSMECQPPVGKSFKITVSIPIIRVKKGSQLILKKMSEKLLKHHPNFLRAPGYEYKNKYVAQDGTYSSKPPVWSYSSALDQGLSSGPYKAGGDDPPTVYTCRSLFEYHHPKMDTIFLDLRQTMRRGNRGDYDNDEFLVVEQLWAVIIPENGMTFSDMPPQMFAERGVFLLETLVTFQSIQSSFRPGKVGGFNTYSFEPNKGTDIIPQGAVHEFFINFADLVLLSHYHILEIFKAGTASLNFRVAYEPISDEELVTDCNTVISEISIILEVTNKQIELLEGVKEAMLLKGSLRPEEYNAATDFYKFLMSRLEVVVAAFADIHSEAKQAQILLFQLLNTESAKQQAAMAMQQALIAKQTAEETAIQLELAKQSSEQNKSFLVFTIITTIFLPLSFFTSYFGMNTIDIRDMDSDQQYFWKTAGPSSALIILVVMCWAFRARMKRGIGMILNRRTNAKNNEEDDIASNIEKGIQISGKRRKDPWHFLSQYRVEKKD